MSGVYSVMEHGYTVSKKQGLKGKEHESGLSCGCARNDFVGSSGDAHPLIGWWVSYSEAKKVCSINKAFLTWTAAPVAVLLCFLMIFGSVSPVMAYDKNLRSGLLLGGRESIRTARLEIEFEQSEGGWMQMGRGEFARSLGENISEMTANMLPFLAGGIYGIVQTTRRVSEAQRGIKKSTGVEVGSASGIGPGAWFERTF